MAFASSKSEKDVKASDEQDPVSRTLGEGTGDQSALQGQASQSQECLNTEESEGMARIQFSEHQPESLDPDSIDEEEKSQDEEAEDIDSDSKDTTDIAQNIFLLFRDRAIKVLHSAIKALLEGMFPPLDAYRTTLEELRKADARFPIKDIMTAFKETIDDLKENGEDADIPERRERRYKEIMLISNDVSFYSKILSVFFKKEYVEEKMFPALKKVVDLRNKSLHYMKDEEEVTLEEVEKALIDAELEIYILRPAKEETAALNKRCSNHNVLTWTQRLQASEFIQDVTSSDVFVSPLMVFEGRPLDDLSIVFGHEEEKKDVCTGLRAVLLSGSCGVGKSTIAYHLVQRWLDGSSPHLAQFEIVFLVDMHRARHSGILAYIQDAMPRTMNKLSSDNFIQCFSDVKVLLVIDGFDARYPRRVSLLTDICDKFKRSTALITTTTDSLSTAQRCFVSVGDASRPVVTVIGFDSERCEAFASKVLAYVKVDVQRNNLREKLEWVMNHRQNLFPCQRESPLVASLIMSILLLNPNVSKVWFESTPKLCHTMFISLRQIHKQNYPHADNPLNESLDDEALLRLGKVCLQELQSDGSLEISNADKHVVGLEEDNTLTLCLVKNEMGSTSDAVYSFCAAAFMHYLAAFYLISDVKIKKRSLHSYFKHTRSFKELLPFLVKDSTLLENCSEDIFNMAKCVTRNTSSDELYSFWYGIVSQIDLNSNNGFRESVSLVLRSLKWSLQKETLVPAAWLLKLCEPGVTQKLNINLAGSHSSSNGLLMQHLRECLLENYSYGDSAILLSLDLGFSDVEASCTWLDVSEEPFFRLVDFTAHVDAESISVLRACQHLSSVTLQLSSLDSFNKFADCYETWQNMKTVKIHVRFLDSLSEISGEQVKRLSNKEGDSEPSSFELIFDGFESRLLTKFFRLLLNILPSNQEFCRIILSDTTLTYTDARKLLSTKFFVDGRLDVKSTCSLSPVEKDRLKAETFRDEDGLHQWPFFQFSWNGRRW